MSGDSIHSLPVNREMTPKPTDLEFMYNLFQPKNKAAIVSAASPFKLSAIAAGLFIVFTLPVVVGLANNIAKNQVYAKLLLAAGYLIAFFLIQKLVMNM